MSLYEAVDQARFKAAQGRELDRAVNGEVPHQPGQVFGEKLKIEPKPAPAAVKPQAPVPVSLPVPLRSVPAAAPSSPASPKTNIWAKKPAMLQVNNGRIEAFLPYPVAGIVVLVVLVLLLAFYHIGSTVGRNRAAKVAQADAQSGENVVAKTKEVARKMARISTTPVETPAIQVVQVPPADNSASANPAVSMGAYVIVLKEMADSRNLAPVKEYFDKNGIPTEIRRGGSSFFLVTKERFESAGKGTPLDELKQKIAQVGKNYKAPPGYGNFGPKMFNDAYGRKLN
ncbi:MAG: hypothetical protein A2Y07_06320 [Planctomycetes bacterium GWF2_50_10]|nr:MAG: hypothetical protein A2Y07_06320 [Planctomycetes bacterium GWF2_50_10]